MKGKFLSFIFSLFTLLIYGQSAKEFKKFGDLRVKTLEYENAIKNYDQAIAIKPKLKGVYFSRGLAFFMLKKYKEALADFEKQELYNPKIENLYFMKGATKALLENFDAAMVDLNKAVESNPKMPQTYYYRGMAYFFLKKYSLALEEINKGIKLVPNEYYFYTGRASIEYELNDKIAAKNDINKALALNSKDAYSYAFKAYILENEGDTIAALSNYNTSIQLNPEEKAFKLARGYLLFCKGETNKAKEDISFVLSKEPDNKEALFVLATSYLKENQFGKAIPIYIKLLQLDSDFKDAAYNLALAKVNVIRETYDMENEEIIVENYPKIEASFKEVLDEFEKAEKSVTDTANYQFYKGLTLYLFYKAKAIYTDGIEDDDEFAKSILENSYLLIDSWKIVSKAIELKPERTLYHFMRFEMNEEIGEYYELYEEELGEPNLFVQNIINTDLISEYTFLISIESDKQQLSTLYSARAYEYKKAEQYDKAVEDCSKIMELFPNDSDAVYQRALNKVKLKQYDAACIDFKKAVQMGVEVAQLSVNKYCGAKK